MKKPAAGREWVPSESVRFYEKQAANYRTLPARDFAGEVACTLAAHECRTCWRSMILSSPGRNGSNKD